MNSAIIKSCSFCVLAFVFSCVCQTENLALAQVERVADEPLEKEDVESSAPVVKADKEVELPQPADLAPAEDDNRVAREPLERDGEAEEAEAAAPAAAGDPEKILNLLDAFNVGGLMDAIQGVPPELQQFMPTLERLLTIEIHFLRKVCNPGPDELKQIRRAGKAELITIAKWLNKNQNRNPGTNDEESPRWRLQNALWKRAEKVLTKEQSARYQQEIQTRNEVQKNAAADMMTLHVDRLLSLSPEQYEQLPALLLKNWKPRWSRNLQVYMYDDYCPLPSASVINPILDDEQKKIWRSKGRDSSIWFGWESDIGLDQFGGGQHLKELDDYSQVEGTK